MPASPGEKKKVASSSEEGRSDPRPRKKGRTIDDLFDEIGMINDATDQEEGDDDATDQEEGDGDYEVVDETDEEREEWTEHFSKNRRKPKTKDHVSTRKHDRGQVRVRVSTRHGTPQRQDSRSPQTSEAEDGYTGSDGDGDDEEEDFQDEDADLVDEAELALDHPAVQQLLSHDFPNSYEFKLRCIGSGCTSAFERFGSFLRHICSHSVTQINDVTIIQAARTLARSKDPAIVKAVRTRREHLNKLIATRKKAVEEGILPSPPKIGRATRAETLLKADRDLLFMRLYRICMVELFEESLREKARERGEEFVEGPGLRDFKSLVQSLNERVEQAIGVFTPQEGPVEQDARSEPTPATQAQQSSRTLVSPTRSALRTRPSSPSLSASPAGSTSTPGPSRVHWSDSPTQPRTSTESPTRPASTSTPKSGSIRGRKSASLSSSMPPPAFTRKTRSSSDTASSKKRT